MAVPELAKRVISGDRRAISRAMTVIENGGRQADLLLAALSRQPDRAFVVGVTGPPGTGKSTLVDRLVSLYRKKGKKVGVVAVDPTSPISGGALLGDRVRMSVHATDPGVFIRSMASRGWSGGLARATSQLTRVLDAAGTDVIFVETVGIGQSDIDVVSLAHAVLVVLMPGLGDDVQMSKAGLMEVGDVYVVNKSDLPGANAMAVNILSMVRGLKGRSPAVVQVSALKSDGLDKLVRAVELLRSRLGSDGAKMKLRRARALIMELAKASALDAFERAAARKADGLAERVVAGELTIDEAARALSR